MIAQKHPAAVASLATTAVIVGARLILHAKLTETEAASVVTAVAAIVSTLFPRVATEVQALEASYLDNAAS